MKQLKSPILNVLDGIKNEPYPGKTLLDVVIYKLINVDKMKVFEVMNLLEMSEATIYRRLRANLDR